MQKIIFASALGVVAANELAENVHVDSAACEDGMCPSEESLIAVKKNDEVAHDGDVHFVNDNGQVTCGPDNADFMDHRGYDCADWEGHQCDHAWRHIRYNEEQLADVRANCPVTCGACETCPDGSPSHVPQCVDLNTDDSDYNGPYCARFTALYEMLPTQPGTGRVLGPHSCQSEIIEACLDENALSPTEDDACHNFRNPDHRREYDSHGAWSSRNANGVGQRGQARHWDSPAEGYELTWWEIIRRSSARAVYAGLRVLNVVPGVNVAVDAVRTLMIHGNEDFLQNINRGVNQLTRSAPLPRTNRDVQWRGGVHWPATGMLVQVAKPVCTESNEGEGNIPNDGSHELPATVQGTIQPHVMAQVDMGLFTVSLSTNQEGVGSCVTVQAHRDDLECSRDHGASFSSDACKRDPPAQNPFQVGCFTSAVYEGSVEAAQQHLLDRCQLTVDDFEVLAWYRADGSIFSHMSNVDYLPPVFRQAWHMILVADKRQENAGTGVRRFSIAFEGTTATSPTDWVSDIMHQVSDLPIPLMDELRAQAFEWFEEFSVHQLDTISGHSAGCNFAKYTFTTGDIESLGHPMVVTYNGFDAYVNSNDNTVDLRAQGDVVSTCLGPMHPISLCLTEESPRNGAAAHSIPNMELVGLTWANLDLNNRYHFVRTPEDDEARQSDEFQRCNAKLLDPEHELYGEVMSHGDYEVGDENLQAIVDLAQQNIRETEADAQPFQHDDGSDEFLGMHYEVSCWGSIRHGL